MRKALLIEGETVAQIAGCTGLHKTTIMYRYKKGLEAYAPRKKEHIYCKNGHYRNEQNTYETLDKKGRTQRRCRVCRAEYQARLRQAKRNAQNPWNK